MKKVIFNALLILTLGMGATAKAEVNDNTIDIPIKTGQGDNFSNRPKAPESIPILCEYEDGVLFFGFRHEIGAITVTVTNDFTGEQWQAILQSTETSSMNVSDNAGSYHINITTIYNKVYYGDFEIL